MTSSRTRPGGLARLAFSFASLALSLVLLLAPGIAAALPKALSVPGGVALIPLGARISGAPAPQAWFGDQPVFVTADQDRWLAVVGIALDVPPGTQTLRVRDAAGERALSFEVTTKRYPEQHIRLKDSGKVQLAPDDEARALGEIETIRALKRHWRETAHTESDFIRPVTGRLSSRFGLRRVFNGEPRAPHVGIDLAVPRGTPVAAGAAGVVLAVDDYFFNGKTVFVDHGNGLITMYCHLDRIDVHAGDAVSGGQRLGLSGMTGRASGPHLHWSVILNGAMVDPELFLD